MFEALIALILPDNAIGPLDLSLYGTFKCFGYFNSPPAAAVSSRAAALNRSGDKSPPGG